MNRKYRYTKQDIESAVKQSKAWTEVCRKVGVPPMTGSQTHLKKKAIAWGIDYSHFLGNAWNRGMVFGPKKSIHTFLRVMKVNYSSHALKLRLIKEGIKKAECEKCGLTEWLGKSAPLELDHINSDHFDNRLENLQILCPNCHAAKGYKRAPVVE